MQLLLRAWHGARPEPFAISPDAMREADLIPGWGRNRYAATRTWLTERGFLDRVHQGGRGARDPSLFILGVPAGEEGTGGRKEKKGCPVILSPDSGPFAGPSATCADNSSGAGMRCRSSSAVGVGHFPPASAEGV
jgi:hypothetical protein